MFKNKKNYFKTRRDWWMILTGFVLGGVATFLLLWQTIIYLGQMLVPDA